MPEPAESPRPEEPPVTERSGGAHRSRAREGHHDGGPAPERSGGWETVEPAEDAPPARSYPRPPTPHPGLVIDMPQVSGPPAERGPRAHRTPSDPAPARSATSGATPVEAVIGGDPAPHPSGPAPGPPPADGPPADDRAGAAAPEPHRDPELAQRYDDRLDEGLGPVPAQDPGPGHGRPDPGYPGSGPDHAGGAPGSNGHAANGHAPNGHAPNGHTAHGHAANGRPAPGDPGPGPGGPGRPPVGYPGSAPPVPPPPGPGPSGPEHPRGSGSGGRPGTGPTGDGPPVRGRTSYERTDHDRWDREQRGRGAPGGSPGVHRPGLDDRSGHGRVGPDGQPGYDRPGYGPSGQGRSGHGRSGYGQQDYEHGGHERQGHERQGHEQSGHEQPGHEQSGHEQSGHEQPGYGRPGHDPSGHGGRVHGPSGSGGPGYGRPPSDPSGYGPSGYDRPGRDRTGGHPPPPGPGPSAERSPYEIVPTPSRGIPGAPGRDGRPAPGRGRPPAGDRGRGLPPPSGLPSAPLRQEVPLPAPVPPAEDGPDEPAPPEPLYVAYRVPVRGTLAGIHIEQLVLWQVVGLAAFFVHDAPLEVLVPTASVAAVVLLLTATRRRGQWTHRYLLHRLHLRRRARAAAASDAPPPLTVQDARLGRRRRLATVFDGRGWSGAIRVDAAGAAGDLPLAALVSAAERFLADVEHDFADVQIVHTLVPAGRTARTRSVSGTHERELAPLVAQTWMTCRVHCVDGRRTDRPVPDLLEVRRDLRRAIDGVLGNLVEEGVDAHALATRPLYDDCVFSAGGRHDGPEPVALPLEPTSSEVERRPAAAVARAAGRGEEVPAECAAVEIDYASDLGDSVHAALAVHRWPEEGFAQWLRSLSRVPARAVSVVITLERGAEQGVEAGVAVRHTTGSPEERDEADRALRDLAADAGVGLRRADTGSHESLLATLPLGSSAAQHLLGPTTRHLVEPEDEDDPRPRVAGVTFGHDRAGAPVAVPLIGPEPRWTAVLGGAEVGAALAASALAGQLAVQVVTPDRALWQHAFSRYAPADRLDVRPAALDQAPPALEATPGLLLLDDYGSSEVVRPALRPWQGGVFRVDPAAGDVESLFAGAAQVIAVRCTDEQAQAICAVLGLDETEAVRFVTVPDGVVTVAGPRGVLHVELDAGLLAQIGMRVTRPSAPARTVRGPMMVG